MRSKNIKVITVNASEVLHPDFFEKTPYGKSCVSKVANVAEVKNTTLGKKLLNKVANVAEVETNGKSCVSKVANVAKVPHLPLLPLPYIDTANTPPIPLASCARVSLNPFYFIKFKEKGLRSSLRYTYICIWQMWQKSNRDKLQTAWNFLKSETAKYPPWAKRHCRKEALEIIRNGIQEHIQKPGNTIPDLDTVLAPIQERYKQEWKHGRRLILPARLLPRSGESFQDWDDRCFAAAEFRKWTGRAA